MASSRIPLRTRLEALSIPEPNTGCWLWTSGVNKPAGYGILTVEGRCVTAHRAAYEAFCGPIPTGLCVCHRCDVKLCINPEHLFLGTVQDNQTDKARKGRGRSSKRGLPFGANPVKTYPSKPFEGRVTVERKRYSAGFYLTAQEASSAALELKERLVPGFKKP
jgi:hypothetical protein